LNDVKAANGLAADEVRYSLQYLDGGTAMPVTVKSISLWRKEAENKTRLLAQTLEQLAKAGADLGVVMAYRLPGNEAKAAIEIYPSHRMRIRKTFQKYLLSSRRTTSTEKRQSLLFWVN
jgi:hypothetical protein